MTTAYKMSKILHVFILITTTCNAAHLGLQQSPLLQALRDPGGGGDGQQRVKRQQADLQQQISIWENNAWSMTALGEYCNCLQQNKCDGSKCTHHNGNDMYSVENDLSDCKEHQPDMCVNITL